VALSLTSRHGEEKKKKEEKFHINGCSDGKKKKKKKRGRPISLNNTKEVTARSAGKEKKGRKGLMCKGRGQERKKREFSCSP